MAWFCGSHLPGSSADVSLPRNRVSVSIDVLSSSDRSICHADFCTTIVFVVGLVFSADSRLPLAGEECRNVEERYCFSAFWAFAAQQELLPDDDPIHGCSLFRCLARLAVTIRVVV